MIDYSLYLVTDKKLAGNTFLTAIIQSAITGGATIIQYREKNASIRKMIEEANQLHEITSKTKIPLIINDRLDVFLAIDAEGIHVGQDDIPAAIARKSIGSKKILGVSVKTVNQALQAVKDGADYLGVGDIFGTQSKTNAGQSIGLQSVTAISQAVSIPIVGIGGITKDNAASVITSGAAGIAVISAIIGKPNTEKETKELKHIITKTQRDDRQIPVMDINE